MAEGYKKQLNEVQLALLNNRQHMINTEVQVGFTQRCTTKEYFASQSSPRHILQRIVFCCCLELDYELL